MIEVVLAAAALAVFVVLAWWAANALKRRGVVVRPVTDIDRDMTRIENSLAARRERARRDDLENGNDPIDRPRRPDSD